MAQTPPEGPDERLRSSGAPGQEPGQPPYGPPSGQPPYGPPSGQAPYGSPSGQPPYGPPPGQPPYGQAALAPQPERRNTWLVPAIIGLAIVLVVGAVVFMLTRTGTGTTTAEPGAGASATEPATAPTDGATAGEAPGEAATAAPTEDTREVSGEPLEPRVDAEVVGTSFVLSDAGWAEHAPGLAAGAREALAGTYTNGTVEVPVTAAAFDSIEAQDSYSEQLTASLKDEGAQLLSDGPVYPDSTGHHWAYQHADGATTTVVWRTDDGVVLTLTGDSEAVPEIYSNMLI
ncbi:hypothetical protein [Georgenia daeguensis]|uniref:Uncharacterized protein n=1 Tax=Georgenia daeguensis TaxID=908355 RepID=A0ABP8EYW5_9MICO